jgi:hypothetical protein
MPGAMLEEAPRDRVVHQHRRADEQHHHVRPEAIRRGVAVAGAVEQGRGGLGRTGGLRHHDGGLRGDRMAALPGLPPAEQLVHDEDRDQQHQQSGHRLRGQRPGRPPASRGWRRTTPSVAPARERLQGADVRPDVRVPGQCPLGGETQDYRHEQLRYPLRIGAGVENPG